MRCARAHVRPLGESTMKSTEYEPTTTSRLERYDDSSNAIRRSSTASPSDPIPQPRRGGPSIGQTGGMTADALALISVNPLVCHGQACLKGTRIPVSIVLDCLSDGMTVEQILEQYQSLSVASIRAAAAYGAELAREELLPLAGDR